MSLVFDIRPFLSGAAAVASACNAWVAPAAAKD